MYLSPAEVPNEISRAAVPTDDKSELVETHNICVVMSTKHLLRPRNSESGKSAILIGNVILIHGTLPNTGAIHSDSRQPETEHCSASDQRRLIDHRLKPVGLDFLDQQLRLILAEHQWDDCETDLSAQKAVRRLVAAQGFSGLPDRVKIFLDLELQTWLTEQPCHAVRLELSELVGKVFERY